VTHRFTKHGLEEMARRGLARELVQGVLDSPAQRVAQRSGRLALQSKVHFKDGEFLLRVIVEPLAEPPAVITAYRTSKIGKYWRPE